MLLMEQEQELKLIKGEVIFPRIDVEAKLEELEAIKSSNLSNRN